MSRWIAFPVRAAHRKGEASSISPSGPPSEMRYRTLIPLALLVAAGCTAHTPEIRDARGRSVPESVATLERIHLGGMDQWVLIRGRNTSNPVLLWLHGGPGSAQMAVRALNRDLEDHFVVVHWDQRGAGKSNPRGFDESTMSVQQFLDDAHQLTQLLKDRFGQERIYLLGHSWGTEIGLLLAWDHPQDYHAYIGVSQVVDRARSQELAHAWLEGRIEEAGSARDRERLARLGQPPYRDHAAYIRFAGMVGSYGGNFDVGMGRLALAALRAPEYTVGDLRAWLRGANRGSGPMWDEPAYRSFDALDKVPRLGVPIYFFQGRNDYNTPLARTRHFADALEAPYGKELVVFEHSAHNPFFGEPEKFTRELVRVKAETFR